MYIKNNILQNVANVPYQTYARPTLLKIATS